MVCSGDIEINPVPKTKNQISFYHWNLNGLAAQNFNKISLLQALSVTHDYDIICLSDTFLDSSISNEDERVNIEGSCWYRSPVQAQDEFEEFFNDLNLLLHNVNDVNVTLSVINGDFNTV